MADIELKFLTLDLIKDQANIEADNHDHDTYLMLLGRAAERKLFGDICRTYDEVLNKWGEWPEDLTLAALLLTSNWYKYREPAENASVSVVPYTYEALYYQYRKSTYSSSSVEGEG